MSLSAKFYRIFRKVPEFTQKLSELKCALCDFQTFGREMISLHVWSKHVLRKNEEKKKSALFYHCRLCKSYFRSVYSHFMRHHKNGSTGFMKGKFDDLRPRYADEYRQIFALCYPSQDERALGKFSIEKITKRSKTKKTAVTKAKKTKKT